MIMGMTQPRFTMVVLLIEDLPRSLAFYRRLGVEFPPDADHRVDVQVPIGDQHQLVLTTTFVQVDTDRVSRRAAGRGSCWSSSSTATTRSTPSTPS